MQTTQRTEALFELLVDTVEHYAIFILDETGHIRTWNEGAENIKGYTAEEIVGEHFSVFYREADVVAGVPDRLLREATREGRVRDEGWRVRADGSKFWADVTITALREGGELVGYAKITHDSTKRRREQLLLEQNQQLKDVVMALSHDLRTPLNVAKGNVDLAIETDDVSRLNAATRGLERVEELLDHLRTLAKEGRQMMEPEWVALDEVAEAAWRIVEPHEGELVIEEKGTLVADQQRLQQLLENLFKNAVDHVGLDVTVSVGILPEGGFYVEDDGAGIPEAQRAEVFERGYSGDSDGTGFGLAICERIADAHGWTIGVITGTDGGARFEVSGVEVA